MSVVRAKTQKTIMDITDAYSVTLSSEAYVFPGTETAAIAGSCTTKVSAYAGNSQIACSVNVASITCPTGITVTSDGDSTAPTLTITASTNFTIAGDVVIPVVVGGGNSSITITKQFSVSIALSGASGSDGEDATLLKIDSSRGVLFKSNVFSTVLTVTIYKGGLTIANSTAMHAEFGQGAYLQWYWRKYEDDNWSVMSVSDSHITDDGFTLTVTPDDVDEKIVFKCELQV